MNLERVSGRILSHKIRRHGAYGAAICAVIAVGAGVVSGLQSTGAVAAQASDNEVNVYSYREPQLIQPLFDAFTAESGITVNVVSAKKGLVERLQAEGANSPADVILTVDIGRLSDVKKAGLTQPVESSVLASNIPEQFRDPDGDWFGLTTRARVIIVSKERVDAESITRYEDLADPQWQYRVCTRSGKHPYMIALTAAMLVHHGEADTQSWLSGMKKNLARKPQGNDRAQAKAIASGECDIALINTYYLAKMAANDEQKAWFEALTPVFPNQQSEGTHVNVSGMALTRHAPHQSAAIKLMEYLSSDDAQRLYAEQNHEYPVKEGVAWSPVVESWGTFKADTVSLAKIAQQRAAAARLADTVDYDGD